ncbi:helix-hairpin-helix domain-containing protein [Lysinibacter sp. HNR]|uniref:helix-hairpin-helix domain-containing protein n=1 Tax=Lysinibacter sp. HNR TaxID=3031408 RepID=UPI002435D824|nr:helix-hairpin-helix domain-containing protein [Lysinibacter sp. HNR]WGD36414.1 helix-hairpin-helix domain-containing protein [Lysinibacter sp. HNR]
MVLAPSHWNLRSDPERGPVKTAGSPGAASGPISGTGAGVDSGVGADPGLAADAGATGRFVSTPDAGLTAGTEATVAPVARNPLRVTLLAACLAFVLALAAVVGWGVVGEWLQSDEAASDSTPEELENSVSSTASNAQGSTPSEPRAAGSGQQVYVHVLGQVVNPGLYVMTEGVRLVDAVAVAGGLTAEADSAAVNLARVISDGEQVYVPALGEVQQVVPQGTPSGGSSGATTGLVNLNVATQAELETLPRVGPTMAQRILEWRQNSGPFSAVEDLLNISGIGEKTFEGLRDLVSVR